MRARNSHRQTLINTHTHNTHRDVLCAGPAMADLPSGPTAELTVFDLAGTDQGGLLADVVALLVSNFALCVTITLLQIEGIQLHNCCVLGFAMNSIFLLQLECLQRLASVFTVCHRRATTAWCSHSRCGRTTNVWHV